MRALSGCTCISVVIGICLIVLSVSLVVVHFVVRILILYQFIQLFPVAILSHIFSLYSRGILGVVFRQVALFYLKSETRFQKQKQLDPIIPEQAHHLISIQGPQS